jgi:putative endonuclease
MSKHSKIGINGEQIAVDFLLNKGYSILFRNWRYEKKEVDIIAIKDDMIVFAEVKTRTGNRLQFPEEAVNSKKQAHLRVAAVAFADQNRNYKNIRFDIISVTMNGTVPKEIVHFEEAFH